MSLNAGDVVGHYRIIEPLGKGGMGEVFAAEDTRLHRRVALKVLPGILATDPGARQRFEREAQAVAALNHPGIVTIHSVEEHAGRLLLTMELVDGRPLGEIIPRGGMALDRLLRIGIEVADALAAAQHTIVRQAPRLGGVRGAILAAVCAIVVVAMTGWLVFGPRRGWSTAGPATFTIDRLSRLTTTGSAFMAAISPDGRYVVHVKGEPGGLSLWTRQTATTSDVRIVPPGEVRFDGLIRAR